MLDVRADGFVVREDQHQFEAIAQFILIDPIFYKLKSAIGSSIPFL